MTDLRASQLFQLTAASVDAPQLRASQLDVISVIENPLAAQLRASQFLVISVVGNGKRVHTLKRSIKLNCWQPCTAHGTYGTVVNLNGYGSN